MGAHVTIIDNNLDRLRELDDIFLSKIATLASSAYMIHDAVAQADLIIGAVLVPGAAAPRLVTRRMLTDVTDGAVIVDVAVDQGGCVETRRRIRSQLIMSKACCITVSQTCPAPCRALQPSH
jgi:alanine dehydrogenase